MVHKDTVKLFVVMTPAILVGFFLALFNSVWVGPAIAVAVLIAVALFLSKKFEWGFLALGAVFAIFMGAFLTVGFT